LFCLFVLVNLTCHNQKMDEIILDFILPCQEVLSDDQGRFSLINVFSNINFKDLPATYPRFMIAAKFSIKTKASGQEFSSEAKILNKNSKEEVDSASFKVNFKKESFLVAINFGKALFSDIGDYEVVVNIEGEKVSRDDQCVLHIKNE